MKQLVTEGIVLSRVDYGEADRIITFLTPEQGKLSLMARGVRRQKSKLAGGVELFSVSDITYINGRGSVGTLISARLQSHYGNIVKQLDRVQLGYELIKILNKATEDHPESSYFELLKVAFESLDNPAIDTGLIRTWFQAYLLNLAGLSPNLYTDTDNNKLTADQSYTFDFEAMTFSPHPDGQFAAGAIKGLRLLFDGHHPFKLQQVQGLQATLDQLLPIVRTMTTTHIRT